MTPSLISMLPLLAAVLAPVAKAAEPCASSAPVVAAERDMQTHLRQAKHFEKKGWLDDAVREIAMARSTTDGRRDPEVFARAAHLARSQDNIVGARCLASATLDLQASGTATEQARRLLAELDRSFGYVVIETSGDATSAAVQLGLPKVFGTAELKAYAERKAKELARRQALPIEIALPAGAYTVSNQSVTVLSGQSQSLTLHPRNTRSPLAAPIARVRGGAAFHPEQAHPTARVLGVADLSITWPIWRENASAVHLGPRFGGLAPAGELGLPAGGDIGLQASAYWFIDRGLDLHVDASVGWASLSGIGWRCPLDGTACTSGDPPAAPTDTLFVRDQGLQLRGTAGLDIRGLGKAEGLGVGVDVGVSRTAGTLSPSTGATDTLAWTLADPTWAVVTVSPGISVSLRR